MLQSNLRTRLKSIALFVIIVYNWQYKSFDEKNGAMESGGTVYTTKRDTKLFHVMDW